MVEVAPDEDEPFQEEMSVQESEDSTLEPMRPPVATPAAVQQRRFYVMNDYIIHSNLSSVQYTAFFNRCRLDGASP